MLSLSTGKDQLLISVSVCGKKLLLTGQTLWQWSRRCVWWHFKHCWPSRTPYRDQDDVTLRYSFQTQSGSLNAFWISEKGKTNSENSAVQLLLLMVFSTCDHKTLSFEDGCSRIGFFDAAFAIHSRGL